MLLIGTPINDSTRLGASVYSAIAYDGLNSLNFNVETMTDQELLSRITVNPKVMVGKPVIKGTRLTVEYILNLLADGATITEILSEYESLVEADIRACVLFAYRAV